MAETFFIGDFVGLNYTILVSRFFCLPKLYCLWPSLGVLFGVRKVFELRSICMCAADFFLAMISFAFFVWGAPKKEQAFLLIYEPDFCSLNYLTNLGSSCFRRLVFSIAFEDEFRVYFFSFEIEVFLWNLGIIKAILNLSASMLALTSLVCEHRRGDRLLSFFKVLAKFIFKGDDIFFVWKHIFWRGLWVSRFFARFMQSNS